MEVQETAPAPAPALTSKQKSKSMRSKMKKPTVKTNLCNPYSVKWPPVPDEDAHYVLEELKREFSLVDFRRSVNRIREEHAEFKLFKRMNSKDKSDYLQKMDSKRPAEELNLRAQLVCGFQVVMKSIEKDSLRLVLVSRDCWDIIKHMAQITCVRGCPGLAVQGLSTCVAGLVGVSSLSALGFRKTTSADSNQFDSLVQNIASRCPKIHLPWLDLEQELQEIEGSSPIDDTKPDDISANQSANEEQSDSDISISSSTVSANVEVHSQKRGTEEGPKDYSHLYIYKHQVAPPPPIVFQEEGVEHVSASKEHLELDDFLAFEEENSTETKSRKTVTKRKKGNVSETESKRMKSNYQSMAVGKLQANSDRKSKKKKDQ